MFLKHGVVLMILLISALGMAGCTGSPSAPVPDTPAPAETAAPVVPYAAWTPETPATGHPYSKTYTFQGSGDYDDFTFSTDSDATWVFRMDPGPGYFLVSLKDARNNEIEVLPPAGSKSVWLKAGNYHFDIAADAPWSVTMSTP